MGEVVVGDGVGDRLRFSSGGKYPCALRVSCLVVGPQVVVVWSACLMSDLMYFHFY